MVARRAVSVGWLVGWCALIAATATPVVAQEKAAPKKPAPKKPAPKKPAEEKPRTASSKDEAPYYRIASFPYDDDFPVEVGAMKLLPDGRLLVGTRTGDVWMVTNPHAEDPKKIEFHRWARGLAQPLGFELLDGWVYTAQRGELTRMRDSDNDGRADEFENVCDDWEISGNYHEYNFGPRLDKTGRMWITTNKPFGGQPLGKAHWRGWAVTVDPKTGVMTPQCAGLRSPAGIEISPEGEPFYTDNQGEWCNASKLAHLEHGDFHGHPHGLITRQLAGEPFASIPDPESGTYMKDLHETIPQFKMPAVWFPYDKMGKSPSGMCWDTSGGKFGPFAGQLFVGDQHHASVLRVCLEKVAGHWQGACFPFRSGFQCGITRVCWGQPGTLFVGMTNAGWGGKGNKRWGIQRLHWTGEMPTEIQTMSARRDGFVLRFTRPMDKERASDPKNYVMESYTYKLQSRYGGPEDDKKPVVVEAAEVSEDGLEVRLRLEEVRRGYVHQLYCGGLQAADGTPVLHPWAYYTLVKVPGDPVQKR